MSGDDSGLYGQADSRFASLLILLGVVEQGLGACSVGTCNPVKVARIPGLPDRVRPVGLITIGYPAERPSKPSNPTLPLHMLVHRNTWQGK